MYTSGWCKFDVLNYAEFLTGLSQSVAPVSAGMMELKLLLKLVMS